MLRKTLSRSSIVGLLLFSYICNTTWMMNMTTTFGGNPLTTRNSKDSTQKNANPPSQKIIMPTAPSLMLTEAGTNLDDIQNSTLGFQKIFVLSMPNRSDKRDALRLSAYLSGLEIEFIDGVNLTLLSHKEYPQNWKADEAPGTLGCWRGHMDIYHKVLRDGIQSAFIMEDYVDWDIMIKAQMTEVARGTRQLQKSPVSPHSPYGDSWDLLVTGHCGMWNKIGEDQEYYVIKDDPTVVKPEHRGWRRKPNLTPRALSGNHTRVILSPYHFTCTGSYAISRSGAARVLYDQAVLPNAQSIDMGLGGLCKRHEYGFSTMITGIHHQAGNVNKESDRKEIATAPDRKSPNSDNLIYPVRLNLGKLLKGETMLKAQYPDRALLPEIDISTLQLPRGSLEFVHKSEYVKDDQKKPV